MEGLHQLANEVRIRHGPALASPAACEHGFDPRHRGIEEPGQDLGLVQEVLRRATVSRHAET